MSIRTFLVSAALLVAFGIGSSRFLLAYEPVTPKEESVDELLNELERLQTQKPRLEKKETELKAKLHKQLEKQSERLKKLGYEPPGHGEVKPTRDNKAPAPFTSNAPNPKRWSLARGTKIPAQFPFTFTQDGAKKDKSEIVVLLLPHLAPGTNREFANSDRQLAGKLAKLLPQMAKKNKDKLTRNLRVISPAQVDKFKLANPRWKEMAVSEIGSKLGADFVLEIELDKMRLYQPGSLNNIYEGRAELSVDIYEIGTEGVKDKYLLSFTYPRNGARSADSMPESKFKMLFFENLATEIAEMHCDCYPSAGETDMQGTPKWRLKGFSTR